MGVDDHGVLGRTGKGPVRLERRGYAVFYRNSLNHRNKNTKTVVRVYCGRITWNLSPC